MKKTDLPPKRSKEMKDMMGRVDEGGFVFGLPKEPDKSPEKKKKP